MLTYLDIISAIEKVIANGMQRAEIDELMHRAAIEGQNGIITKALHQSYHYISDKDLFEKDPIYRDEMILLLKTYMAEIRELDENKGTDF